MLACLIFALIFSPNLGSTVFLLFLTVPLAVVYAIVEYRYWDFRATKNLPPNLRVEYAWAALAVLAAGWWAYIGGDAWDVRALDFLRVLAYGRAIHFIMGTITFVKHR
jgi:hypothetical protein